MTLMAFDKCSQTASNGRRIEVKSLLLTPHNIARRPERLECSITLCL